MTYQDLIEELSSYSPKELQQNVMYLISSDYKFEVDETVCLSEVDSATCIGFNDRQIYMVV
jgi:hypothetical protein